jgi:K+-sensing histidine kinase KdpD
MLSLIAKALEKAELRALIAFHDISKAIFSIVSLHDLLPALADLSLQLLHADDVSLFLLQDDGTLECAVSRGLTAPCVFRSDLARNVIEKSRTPAEECVVAGPGEATQAMDEAAAAAGVQSFLVAPLSSNGKLLGAWCACRTSHPEPFSRNEEDYANIFVAQVSQAIYNAQLYAELSAKADTLDTARTQLADVKQELAHRERLAAIARITPPLTQRVQQLLADLWVNDTPQELPALKDRLARLHGMLANLSRFVTPAIAETAVNLNEVIAQSLELLGCAGPDGKPAVTVTYDRNLQPLTADFSQMEHVIIEVVSFLRARLAHTAPATIGIATRELSNRVQVEFTDNGPVLTPHGEDDFFTLAAHTPEGAHVPAVREIISKYNGCMTVHNRQEGQTVFSLEFPRH